MSVKFRTNLWLVPLKIHNDFSTGVEKQQKIMTFGIFYFIFNLQLMIDRSQ
jgi:hypothetical protein